MHARGGGKIVIGKYRFKAVAGQKPPTAGPRRALKSATTRQISPVTSTGGEPRLNPSAHRSLRVDRVSCGWTQGVADRQVELVQRYQRKRGLRTKCGARGQGVEPLRGVGPLRPRPDHVGCPVVALGFKLRISSSTGCRLR